MSAADVHKRAIIIDGLFNKTYAPIDPEPEVDDMMFDHILASGVTAFNDSAIADSFPYDFHGAVHRLYEEQGIIESVSDKALIVRTVDDIHEAKRSGRVGVILSAQGLHAMGDDTRNLWALYKLDLRIGQLTYNERNAIGCGCMEPNDTGLTRIGQKAVEELNRLGVVVDLSHGGERTSLDAAKHSRSPVTISHAGVRALNPHRRNVSDELIRAVAGTGGVIGLCPHSIMVEKARGQRPSIDDYIDHIEYVVGLTGIEHVGIGTDNFQYDNHFAHIGRKKFERTFPTFFGGYGPTEKHAAGFSRWRDWPNLTANLLRRGFSEADTAKILGGNFMRVFGQVWQ